jgi:hypothetical protein
MSEEFEEWYKTVQKNPQHGRTGCQDAWDASAKILHIGMKETIAWQQNKFARIESELRASATTLEAEIKRLKAALVECEHQTHSMRVWGGESWTYHPPQAEKIAKFARAALDA